MAVGAPPGPEPGPARSSSGGGHVGAPAAAVPVEDAGDPALGCLDLAVARQRLGTRPERRQGRRSARVGDGAHEPLALLVLLHLEVHPGQPEHRALERRALGAPLVEPLADPLDTGHEIAPDLVHDVVAEALEQAHHGLRLAEDRLLLGAHHPLDPVLAAALAAERPAEALDDLAAHPLGVLAEQRQLALEAFGEIRPEPGMRLELEGVGRLVQRDPGPERPERHVQGAGRRPDVLLDEQQPAGRRLGREQREVVLAEDARAHEAEQEARAGGSSPSGWRGPSSPWPVRRRGGMTWSSRSASSLPISERNEPVLARTQPARSTTPDRSTTPGSGLPRAVDRAGTMRAIASA